MLLSFFSGLQVELVEEEDGNLFPAIQSAKTILGALLDEAGKHKVRLEYLRKVARIERCPEKFFVTGAGFAYEARTVVLATGGLSYPDTGSDGSGYALARSLGHRIIPTSPALVPLRSNDAESNSLAGITLPVELFFVADGKKIVSAKGPLLFTHTGFSGPAVMDLSRHWIRFEKREEAGILVNFLPKETTDRFLEGFAKTAEEQPALGLKKALAKYFPERLAELLIRKGGLDPQLQMAHCSKKDRQSLAHAVFSFPLPADAAFGYEKAEVTAGGIDLEETDPKTLESKLQPGLFFAGEVLDVDGRIGGFNLQWAWASGYVAGEAAVKKLGSGAETK